MTISELMLQRQALIKQTRAVEHQIRNALTALYGITKGTHVQCFKRSLVVTKTETSFRQSTPRLYVTGFDTLHPASEHTYGWDPKHCRIIPKTP